MSRAAQAKQAVVEDDESWKTADPYAFLPDPEANTDVHEELTLSDGSVHRFCNTDAQLKQHLSATGGAVCPPPRCLSPLCLCSSMWRGRHCARVRPCNHACVFTYLQLHAARN